MPDNSRTHINATCLPRNHRDQQCSVDDYAVVRPSTLYITNQGLGCELGMTARARRINARKPKRTRPKLAGLPSVQNTSAQPTAYMSVLGARSPFYGRNQSREMVNRSHQSVTAITTLTALSESSQHARTEHAESRSTVAP